MLCFDHVVIRRCRVCLEAYFVLLTSAPGLEPASNREVLQLLECGKFSIFRWCRETVPGNFPFLLRFFLLKKSDFFTGTGTQTAPGTALFTSPPHVFSRKPGVPVLWLVSGTETHHQNPWGPFGPVTAPQHRGKSENYCLQCN